MTDEAKALVERFKGHTPGPWAYRDNKIVAVNVKPDWADLGEDYADERISVVDLYGAMGGIDTCADAQLIAAAPEMLALIETQAREIERLRAALKRWQYSGCPDCRGDCGSANPPVMCCIMEETRAALAGDSHDH